MDEEEEKEAESCTEDKPRSARPSTATEEHFNEDSRVVVKNGANASLVMETMLSSIFI